MFLGNFWKNILNYSSDLITWETQTDINNTFLQTISLATDYEKFNNFINHDLNLCKNAYTWITDLSSQEFSWSGSGNGNQYLIQLIDSSNYNNFFDLISTTETIYTSLNLNNEYLYFGIISTINNNIVSSRYFKFWSFNYTNFSVIKFNNGETDFGYTFSFSYGITGDDNHSLESLGVGINNVNDKLCLRVFQIENINNFDLNNSEISFNISYEDLNVYLTDNTNYLFSVVGVYKQNDIPTTYVINTICETPFLFNAS